MPDCIRSMRFSHVSDTRNMFFILPVMYLESHENSIALP